MDETKKGSIGSSFNTFLEDQGTLEETTNQAIERINRMRDPKRIPIMLEKLRELWELAPDQRLGQLIENAKDMSKFHNINMFSIEDDMIESGIDKMIQEYKKL